jgi:hypothetical protein
VERLDEIINLNKKLGEVVNNHWWNDVVFTFPWWFVILSLILPWIVWWKIVNKKRILETSFVGLFIMFISFFLDQLGASLLLWIYPVTPTPLPREVFDPADLSILPVFYMAIYQYFPRWKSYILILTIFAFLGSYVGGSIYQWLGIYKILKWKHIYSVPIYILMGVIAKWIINKLEEIQSK